MDRIHRIGQSLPCKATWLQATQTDVMIDKLIIDKANNADMVLTGGQSAKTDLNNAGELAKLMSDSLFGGN